MSLKMTSSVAGSGLVEQKHKDEAYDGKTDDPSFTPLPRL
jgi:hypothetical protein